MDIGGSARNYVQGSAEAPANATSSPAFVFGPQVEGGVDPELVTVIREEAGTALDDWCACTGDPLLAAGISRFLDSGDIPRLWRQSAVTAVQLAVAAALGRRGLEPGVVAGLSTGELAAAVAAGRLDLGDATRVAREVSALFAASASDIRMAAVATSRTILARVLDASGSALAITLAPRMQVIAGGRDDIERVSLTLREMGIDVHGLRLPGAIRSTAAEALRAPFLRQLGPLAYRPGHARFYSGIDASRSPQLDAEYWWNVCRRSFHFDDAIRAMLANGIRWFVEIGPRPVVARYILAIAAELGVAIRVDSAHELLLEAQLPPLRITAS
ncbi:MAG TPA: acyltransferase domain-containing protein [Kofleriaceae bacterium]|nr:acyltransferase domain-containing protein [Kofleriaceae bacterium]